MRCFSLRTARRNNTDSLLLQGVEYTEHSSLFFVLYPSYLSLLGCRFCFFPPLYSWSTWTFARGKKGERENAYGLVRCSGPQEKPLLSLNNNVPFGFLASFLLENIFNHYIFGLYFLTKLFFLNPVHSSVAERVIWESRCFHLSSKSTCDSQVLT
jgi:hypothetical protein